VAAAVAVSGFTATVLTSRSLFLVPV